MNTFNCKNLLILNARNGNIEAVWKLLQEGANVNAIEGDITPLQAAFEGKHYNVVRLLLQRQSINVNYQNANGSFPLKIACYQGNKEMINTLLTHPDINVNLKGTIDNCTVLIYACRRGDIETVKALLAKPEIDKTVKDNFGNTALIAASSHGHAEIVKLLVDDCTINMTNSSGNTALIEASKKGHSSVVRVLLTNAQINVHVRNTDFQRSNALIESYDAYNQDILNLLLEAGAGLSYFFYHGCSWRSAMLKHRFQLLSSKLGIEDFELFYPHPSIAGKYITSLTELSALTLRDKLAMIRKLPENIEDIHWGVKKILGDAVRMKALINHQPECSSMSQEVGDLPLSEKPADLPIELIDKVYSYVAGSKAYVSPFEFKDKMIAVGHQVFQSDIDTDMNGGPSSSVMRTHESIQTLREESEGHDRKRKAESELKVNKRLKYT